MNYSIIISLISIILSSAAFVFSIYKFKSQNKVVFNIKCIFNNGDKQCCTISNQTNNNARNITITILSSGYTLTDKKINKINIEYLAAQNTYNFILRREFTIDGEFTEVKALIEWRDDFRWHNKQFMLIQIPENNGF